MPLQAHAADELDMIAVMHHYCSWLYYAPRPAIYIQRLRAGTLIIPSAEIMLKH